MNSGGALAFGGFWLLLWSAFTLGFDGILLKGFVQQAMTRSWPMTHGRVVSSDIDVDSDGESGTSYKAKVRYTYAVSGQSYQSDRVRYGMSVSERKAAQRAVREYPAGREIVVLFNPSNPAEAVLDSNLAGGGDAFATIFMTPFNLIMMGGWMMVILGVRGGVSSMPPPAGGPTIRSDPDGVRVCLSRYTPVGAAMVAILATSFAMIFIIGIGFGSDSIAAVAAGWAIIIGAAIFAYRITRAWIDSGRFDLVINDKRRTIELPMTCGRKETLVVKQNDVADIRVEKIPGTGDDSDRYHVVLHRVDGDLQTVPVVDFPTREKADALASWLRKRLDTTPQASLSGALA